MCAVLEVVDCFLLQLPEQPIINDIHKTNPQFRDKYDTESFEHTTVFTSALCNVYQSKQNRLFVNSWNYSYSYSAEYSQLLFRAALV